jgi:hypothetical protein
MRIVAALSIKNITVYDVDPDVFTNPFVEAATRFIEEMRGVPDINIGAVIECWPAAEEFQDSPVPPPVVRVNSYLALVNAARYETAERLRQAVLKQHSLDLATEPLSNVIV